MHYLFSNVLGDRKEEGDGHVSQASEQGSFGQEVSARPETDEGAQRSWGVAWRFPSVVMPCYHPLSAWRTDQGKVVFREGPDAVASLFLPCGRCVGCRLERARQWAVRIMHEAQLHESNSFVTLTYAEEHLPPYGSLNYPDVQAFLKRLRARFGQVRFFCCGEYGEQFQRPHYHLGIFGCDFRSDRKPWRTSRSGHRLFRSRTLESLWPMGSSEIGNLTVESAAYMARYSFKKVSGELAADHYRVVDPETGEVFYREPEFARMSLRPGIGAKWFAKHGSYVAAHDHVVTKGVPAKPPRYYDTLLERADPDRMEEIKEARMEAAKLGAADQTDERLAVREVVTQARFSNQKRNLK